jgi:predicted phosphoribosyltransferase
MPVLESRQAAARFLAERLQSLRGSRPLVLGIPRGGVPMGAILADALAGDLDVVLVRKIGAPWQPEFAIGAVDEHGVVHLNPDATHLEIDAGYVRQEAERQLAEIRRRRDLYTPGRGPADATGRTVVVVDDGVATGATFAAALELIRERRPARLVAAVGVLPASAVERLASRVDQLVYLMAPEDFYAVGQFYADFRPVGDDEVVAALRERQPERRAADPAARAGR